MRASEFIINLEQHDRNLLKKALLRRLRQDVENSRKRLQMEKDRQRRQRELERQRRMAQDV